MKKTVSSILLASALLLGAIAPVTANAAAVNTTGGTGTTSGTVTFTKPDSTTVPVDPTDPSNPGAGGDTGDTGGTKPTGDLSFLYVSPDMDFGKSAADQTAGAAAVKYNPKTITATPFKAAPATPTLLTEVSDSRGSSAGWQVSVKSSALTDTSDATNTVTGATIDLNGGNATVLNSAEKDTAQLATGTDANLTTGATGMPIYTAAKGTGVGATTMQLKAEDIALSNIPSNIKASVNGTTYKATLTWTLGDTPEG